MKRKFYTRVSVHVPESGELLGSRNFERTFTTSRGRKRVWRAMYYDALRFWHDEYNAYGTMEFEALPQ